MNGNEWTTSVLMAIMMAVQTFILFKGLRSLRLTRETMVTNTTAMLSQRMFEINKLEFENPRFFRYLKLGHEELDAANQGQSPVNPDVATLLGSAEQRQKTDHYMFMLFSYYEQLFLLSERTIGCFHKSWVTRFGKHMDIRPRFKEYWLDDYSKDCSEDFRTYVNNTSF